MGFLKRYWGRILGGICLAVAASAGLMWWMMTQPMYQPGDVRAGRNVSGPLVPPAQMAGETWQMQPLAITEGGIPLGQTLGQTASFRQTAPETWCQSRVCGAHTDRHFRQSPGFATSSPAPCAGTVKRCILWLSTSSKRPVS